MTVKATVRGLDGFRQELTVSRDKFVDGSRMFLSELASDTAKDARAKASRGQLTGASMNSIQARGTTVRAGDDVPWYGFADFGGKVGRKRSISRPYTKGGRWLFPAVRELGVMKRANDVVEKATKGLR